MKTKKNKQIKNLILTLFVLTLFVLTLFVDVKGQPIETDPINYDFNNNILFDKDESFTPNFYNVRNQSYYTNEYIATETFEYEDISVISDKWNFYIPSGCSVNLTSEFGKNNKVLELYHNNEADISYSNYVLLSNYSEGIIEMYYRKDVSNLNSYIYFYGSGIENSITLLFSTNAKIDYFDGNWNTITDYRHNIWYHLKIIFDVSGFYLHVNGLEFGKYDFRGNPSYFSTISFSAPNTPSQYVYVENIDLSWSNGYFNNRILTPKKIQTNQLEVDKFEFDYQYGLFESNYYNWIQNEYNSTTNDVEIYGPEDYDINKYVSIFTPAQSWTYENGIEYNKNSSSYIVDITFNFHIDVIDPFCAHIFYIFPQNADIDRPIGVKFNGYDQKIHIYNPYTDYEEISGFTLDIDYNLNIHLDYYFGVIIYNLTSTSENFLYIHSLKDPNYWIDLYGLEKIQINNSMSTHGNAAFSIINSVSIYENNTSYQPIMDEGKFSLMIYELDVSWFSQNHNFITLDSINDYRLYVFSDCAKFSCGINLRERSIQSEKELINIQNDIFSYPYPYLTFQSFKNFTIPFQIEIKGISLINEYDEIFARYLYINSDSDNNYFYVINNELHYNFNNSLDLGIEIMSIKFDVVDTILDDESVFTYTSYISSFYEGYIDLRSYILFEQFNISNNDVPITRSYNLTDIESFVLTEIRIHLRTDLLDNAENMTNGFVRNLNIWLDIPLYLDYDPIGIIDLDFLDAMVYVSIRLIIFLIPSLVFRYKFGNKSVIPMWFLMSLVLVISGFIPFWLFFVNLIAIGLMLITKKDEV